MKPVWLLLLLVVCLAAVAGAWFVVQGQNAATQGNESLRSAGDLVFPVLVDNADAADHIEIITNRGQLAFRRDGDAWVMPVRGDFPVEREKLRRLIVGLARVRVIEPKTADPANHATLFLNEPNPFSGEGRPGEGPMRIRISRDNGSDLMADAIVGGSTYQAETSRLYLRDARENQTYLVEGVVAVEANPMRWVPDPIVRMRRADVARVEVTRPDGDYTLIPTPDGEQTLGPSNVIPFRLETLAENEEMTSLTLGGSIASALDYLRTVDIARTDDIASTEPLTTLTYISNDGLRLRVRVFPADDSGAWMAFDATTADDATEEAARQANDLNDRVGGFAFKAPEFAANRFRHARSELVSEASKQTLRKRREAAEAAASAGEPDDSEDEPTTTPAEEPSNEGSADDQP